jgi:hypothetical protein
MVPEVCPDHPDSVIDSVITQMANPFDTLRKVNNILANTRQTDYLCQFDVEALFRITLACIDCEYDVTPCDLTEREIGLALSNEIDALNESLRRLD